MNKRHCIHFSAIAIIVMCITAVFAADDVHKNAGTSGAQFLKINVGARPAALADSQVALADDANSPVQNPAGMGFLFSPEIQATHGLWLADQFYDLIVVSENCTWNQAEFFIFGCHIRRCFRVLVCNPALYCT